MNKLSKSEREKRLRDMQKKTDKWVSCAAIVSTIALAVSFFSLGVAIARFLFK